MANRRMFSKDIVRSDAFLDLSLSAQALYFHLGMEADDRGYVNSPKSIIRGLGANVGDLEQLANKRFILIRGENLILIKGWRINNYIQNDRMSETKFVDDLKKLYFDSNNSYTERETDSPCIQFGYSLDTLDTLDTQDRLGKDSIGKVSIEQDSKVDIRDIKDIKDITRSGFSTSNPNLNPFVRYLISTNFLQEKDYIAIPLIEEFYESLFADYHTQSEQWHARYRNVVIATKYMVTYAQDPKSIGDKLNYIKTSITDSLTRDYQKHDKYFDCLEEDLNLMGLLKEHQN